MQRRKTMIGDQFGRWSVVDQAPNGRNYTRRWLCLCACGVERIVYEPELLAGRSQSCGCRRKEARRCTANPKYDANIRTLYADGLSYREIQARLGCSVWTVKRALAEVDDDGDEEIDDYVRCRCGLRADRGKTECNACLPTVTSFLRSEPTYPAPATVSIETYKAVTRACDRILGKAR